MYSPRGHWVKGDASSAESDADVKLQTLNLSLDGMGSRTDVEDFYLPRSHELIKNETPRHEYKRYLYLCFGSTGA